MDAPQLTKPLARLLVAMEIQGLHLEEPLDPDLAKAWMKLNLAPIPMEAWSANKPLNKLSPQMRTVINLKVR